MSVRKNMILERAQACGGELLEAVRLIHRHALNQDLSEKSRLALIVDLSSAVLDKIEEPRAA